MESIPKDALTLLQFLLPGFLAAWVFYAFTSYPRPSQFERVIQALIFTLFCQAGVFAIHSLAIALGNHYSFGEWTAQSETIISIISGFLVGLLFSYFANTDHFHRWARTLKVTRETSYPSEWFGAFHLNNTYVVLQLKDKRRLFGWPTEWPSAPTTGHFFLENVSWQNERGKELPLTGAKGILVNVCDVQWVEFVEFRSSINEQEGVQSTSTLGTGSAGATGH